MVEDPFLFVVLQHSIRTGEGQTVEVGRGFPALEQQPKAQADDSCDGYFSINEDKLVQINKYKNIH